MSEFSNTFTYVICSDDRTNTTLPAAGEAVFYDVDFGDFSEEYDDYMCEVVSFTLMSGIVIAQAYWMLCAKNLTENGYFCKSKLSPKDCVLVLMPLTALQEALIQSDGGYSKIRINNCRSIKQVTFTLLKPDFTPVLCGTEINIPPGQTPVETNWLLVLKMTPIEKGQ